MAERPQLPPERITTEVRNQMASFHRDVVDEVIAALGDHDVLVVGMGQNAHVRKARQALDRAGIPFKYLEYGNYLDGWRRRLAIKLWSGYPTFPQVFVRGALIGGNVELQAMLRSGSLNDELAGTRMPRDV